MSVQRREVNGKVKYVARVRDYTGKERSKTFDKRRDALKWESETLPTVKAKGWVALKAGTTVEEVVQRRIDSAERANTRSARVQLKRNLGPLKKMDVSEVRRSHIVHWVDLLYSGRPWADGRGLKRNSVRGLLGQLGGAFSYLMEIEAVGVNPCSRVQVPGESKEIEVPSVEEIRKAAEAGAERFGEDFKHVVYLSARTGLRASEVSAIQCGDVDLKADSIAVRRQLSRSGVVSPLKTAKSRRVVPLPAQMREIIEARVAEREAEDWLFCQPSGAPWTNRKLGNCLYYMGAGFTFHGLRHFCASSLIEAGVNIKAIQELLGHSSLSTTTDTYAHLLLPSLDSVRSASDRIFAG